MITFNSENVNLPDLDYDQVRNWIAEVAATHGFSVGRLGYLFCDDNYILEANRKFLGHDYFTDVITFDSTRVNRISGDIIISVDTVSTNAGNRREDPVKELLRVIIHGVLHLCGINDKGPGEREIMEDYENKALLLLQ